MTSSYSANRDKTLWSSLGREYAGHPKVCTWDCGMTDITENAKGYWWYCCNRKSRAAHAQSFALWQQATIEFTCHDHSSRTLLLRSIVDIVSITRDYTPRSLSYWLFAPHMCMVLFFTHIPFVVNHTINATPPERLQQYNETFFDCTPSLFRLKKRIKAGFGLNNKSPESRMTSSFFRGRVNTDTTLLRVFKYIWLLRPSHFLFFNLIAVHCTLD